MNLKSTGKILFSIFVCTFTANAVSAQDSTDVASDSLMQIYELSDFVVSATTPLVKVELDKIIYNTAEDSEAKTSTVLDMLKKVPLVTVDADDKISLKGSSNFVVYMNGKPSGMFAQNPEEVLKNMPAGTVKNIEVITDPGAKYDAEGVSGIINIVTVSQTSLNGFTATVSGGVDSRGGGDAGVYLMAKKGKFGFAGSLDGYRYRRPNSDVDKISENFLDHTTISEKADIDIDGYGLYGSGELSFEIDTLNLINAGYSVRYGRQNIFWDGAISQTQAGNFLYAADRTEKGKYDWGATDVNVDYQHTFAKNTERLLTLSYRFSYSPRDTDSESLFFNPIPTDNFPAHIPLDKIRQYTDARTNEHTFQADFTTPFGKIHSLETGLKYILRLNKSNSDYLSFNDANGWQSLYSEGSEHNDVTLFQHRNDIMAAYGSYALKLGKWGLRAGLRYEFTLLSVEFERNTNQNFSKNYGNFVPSIVGSYKINDVQNIRLGYNMRLNRPGIWQLNPYINDSNPNFISVGNPALNAVQTHSISLNYGFFKQKFNLNANLSQEFTNNSIEQITQIGNGGTSVSTYENIGKKQETRLMLYLSWTPIEQLKIFANLFGKYSDIRAGDGSLSNRYFFYGFVYGGVEYRLPWKIWITGNVGGGSPQKTLQTASSHSWWHQLTVRRDFFNDRLSVRIYANNPFTSKFRNKEFTQNPNFYQETNIVMNPREFGFVISYRFGELKAQLKKTSKSIENDDVIQQGQDSGK